MPVGRALDSEPVDVAVLVDVGQPRHFGIFDVAVVDQRVTFRLAKAAPERRQLAGSQILVARSSTPIRIGLLALVLAARMAPVLAQATSPTTEREATLTVTVVPRSESGAFRDTTLVYLDGRIDPGAPDRLSKALHGINGRTAIWLNSAGGNLFAGMQLGRVIRRHGASTNIIDARTLLPGKCYSACSLAFLGGVYRFGDNGARYGVHSASLGPAGEDADRASDLSAAVGSYIREMGVDVRLLELWTKARPDQMYVLSQKQAEDLGVVNNGRKPPEWGFAPGGSRLQGRQ